MTYLENIFLDDDYQSKEYIKKRERKTNPSVTLTYNETAPLLEQIFKINQMKEHIFIQYLKKIAKHLEVDDNLILEKTQIRHIVEARRLLWFLCSEHGMTPTEIKRHTKNLSSIDFQRSTIDRGIVSIKETIRKDPDYNYIISKLKQIDI